MRWMCCLLLLAGCSNDQSLSTHDAGIDMSAGIDMPAPAGDMMTTQMSCDPVAQDCADPTQRCTYSITGTGSSRMLITECIADGTAMRDQTCTIDMSTRVDNCAKGLVCTGVALPTGMDACRKFCKTDADCGAGQQCHGIFGAGFGECLPTCTEFGTGCGTGMTCATVESDIASTMTMPKSFLVCRSAGAKMAGDDCTRATDCGADMLCLGPQGQGMCTPLCDSVTHPSCPTYGKADGGTDGGVVTTCMPYRGLQACQ